MRHAHFSFLFRLHRDRVQEDFDEGRNNGLPSALLPTTASSPQLTPDFMLKKIVPFFVLLLSPPDGQGLTLAYCIKSSTYLFAGLGDNS